MASASPESPRAHRMHLEDSLYPLLKLYESAPQPVKLLAGTVYRAIPASWRNGPAFPTFQRDAREVENWDADAIRRYQTAAVRESLLAASKAPFYAKRFAEHGVDPTRFESLEQLSAYPLLTKDELLRERENLANPALRHERLPMTTGGSSGIPVGFDLHKGISRPKEQAYLDATWARCGYRHGDRVAVIRGGVTSTRADGTIRYHDATRDWLVLSSSHLTAARLSDYARELNRFQPKHLLCYPSAALMLMQLGIKLDFPLTSLLCGSEKLSAEAQRLLEAYFKVPIMHWYGHSERVVLAAQRPGSTALHFWPTYGLVEFGEADAAGNREIIGTSFHNHVMPLIRYRTGDFARVAESASWRVVEAITGRDYEFLISRTGRRISLTAINMHDDLFDGLLAVQFHQHQPGEAECHLLPSPNWSRDREAVIHSGLMQKLGDDFTLTLRVTDHVEQTSAGKHRWLVTSLK
ncbi:MAG: phenylacetate--CoA ligase family protein [Verrucomicrobiaceae bacterium]|nr:phenylacetate--CoA ligase family protein [Verrucomicrobiaceae bacterium]